MKIAVLLMTALSAVSVVAAENPEGIQSFRFGECEIICVQDTASKMPQKLFADAAATGFRQTEPFYDASVNVFVVRQGGRIMLIDAGNDPSRGSLRGKLRQAKVAAESVTDVFITHLHPDHVGGLLWDGQPLFPKAVIHIAREELAAWKKDSQRGGLAKYWSPYGRRVQEFEFGETLPGGLVPLKRGGHTPGHTVFTLSLPGGQEALFVGDIAHGVALQFPYPTFCARFDAAPREAVQSRVQTLQTKGLLFGAHFPFPGVAEGGAVVKGGPGWSFAYRAYTPGK